MDKELSEKERQLEIVKLDSEIEQHRLSIEEKRALERAMRKQEGRNWRKILGVVKGMRPNPEVVHDLYTINPALRELAKPPSVRRA